MGPPNTVPLTLGVVTVPVVPGAVVVAGVVIVPEVLGEVVVAVPVEMGVGAVPVVLVLGVMIVPVEVMVPTGAIVPVVLGEVVVAVPVEMGVELGAAVVAVPVEMGAVAAPVVPVVVPVPAVPVVALVPVIVPVPVVPVVAPVPLVPLIVGVPVVPVWADRAPAAVRTRAIRIANSLLLMIPLLSGENASCISGGAFVEGLPLGPCVMQRILQPRCQRRDPGLEAGVSREELPVNQAAVSFL
jgi:signal-induced proliferation-associated 1 like protein 3